MNKAEIQGVSPHPAGGYVFYICVAGVHFVSALSFKTLLEAKKYQDIVKEALKDA